MSNAFIGALRLSDSLEQAISSELTIVFFAATAVAFVLFAWLLLRAGGARKRLAAIVAHYERSVRSGLAEGRIPAPTSRRDRVGALIRACLEEFDRRLVKSKKRTRRGLSGQDVIDSERIVQEVDIFFGWFPYDIVRLGPAVLTALGLLGTFFGITDGLGAIGDIQVQGSGAILPIVSEVVKGLATAFWTSIVGVVSGVFIMWWSRTTEHKLEVAVEQAVETLDGLFDLVTPEQLSRHAQKIGRRKLRELEVHSGQLTKIALDTRRSQETIGTVAAQLETTNDHADGLLQLMRRLTEDSEDSRSLLQQLIDDLGKTFTAAFEQTMTPQLEQMVTAIREQVGKVAATGSDTAKQFAEDLIGSVAGELRESFSGMASSVGGFRDDFELLMSRMDETISSQAAVVQAGLEATRLAQESTAATSAEMARVQGAIADTTEVVATLASVGGDLRGLVATVERAGATYQTAATSLGDFARQFTENTTRLYQAVIGFGRAIGESTTRLERTLGQLDARLEAERELVAQYATVGAEVREVVKLATPTFSHLGSSSEHLARVAGSLAETVTHLSTAPATVEAATDALSNTATQLQGAADSVREVADSMTGWRDEATSSVNEFSEGLVSAIKSSLAVYDASLSHAVSSISSAMEDLDEMLSEVRKRRDGELTAGSS